MNLFRPCLATAGLSIALLLSPAAEARLTLCAGSASEIASRIATINSQPGQDFDLRIRAGYYTLSGNGATAAMNIERSFLASAGEEGKHRISGAWNSDCSDQIVDPGASATVLDGQQTFRLLHVLVSGTVADSAVHELQIDRLIFFQAAEETNFNQASALSIGVAITNATRLRVILDRVRFQDNYGNQVAQMADVDQATIRNSIFLYNECPMVSGQCASPYNNASLIEIGTRGFGRVFVRNNTSRLNFAQFGADGGARRALRIGEKNGSFSSADIHNNIFGDPVALSRIEADMSARVTFRHNVTGPAATIVLSSNNVESSDNLTVDPGFASASSLALSNSSLLRDRGLTVVPGGASEGPVDYIGNVRVQGAAVEPGAYELADQRIFRNGFD
jgi:hypothetical protein